MKFNINKKAATATVNHEGAIAYSLSPEMELYTAVATTLLSDVTYEKADARMQRIIELLPQVAPEFIAQLAVYARKEMNLRTAPLVLATALANVHRGDSLVSKAVAGVVQRPDEIMEMLACYQVLNKREGIKKLNRLSKQMQKGLATAFNRFDEYQFAKYNRNTEVKLKDALFLVHPKAKDEAQQVLFNKIVSDEMATPYTWETELSALGQKVFVNAAEKQAAVKATWEELIDSRKLGYMAVLRNLRNILQAGVSAVHVERVGEYLANENAVLNAKQLPFRFLSAYRELMNVESGYNAYLLDALESAIASSVQNMPGFNRNTRVVVACDVSGSMYKPVSKNSAVQLYDIGLLLGMLLQSKCKHVQTGIFGDTWKRISLPARNVLSNVDVLRKREGEVGYATNGYLVLKDLVDRKYVADKVMLFTDMQMWDSNTNNVSNVNTLEYQWRQYKAIAPDAKLYVFDLAGYGHSPIKQQGRDVFLIAGWSDKIFAVLEAIEHGEDTLSAVREVAL
ncbi:hypothetical protein HNQ91_005840 [Filimonas zeae]|uniref:Ribonucleoprotein n=1 Tax=Filimonas zeae TaxID=1737353 RepID=A0A917J5R0_9BACT|nr:TROVE domain-containing protein [Filimonas zeae]MDR6342755.1 hypothetical protein [Filimonas zeae]GGH82578.1 ribonucleoprotein [Filimonas zeae]